MQEAVRIRMDADTFFDWHMRQDGKFELIDGVPVAMTGANRRHNVVALNAAFIARPLLNGGHCTPFVADFAVKIPNGNVRYPDFSIDCGDTADESMAASKPVLVLEVMSRSTSRFDQTEKLEEYKTVASLLYIVRVDPAAPRLRIYERDGETWRSRLVAGMDQVAELPGLELRLPLAELYAGVAFLPGPLLVIDDEPPRAS